MLITLVSVLATFSPVSCHNLHLFLSNFGGIYYLRVVKYLFHFLCPLILVRRISFQKNGLNVYQLWRLFLLVLIESRFMILNDWASQDAFTLNSFLLMVIMIIFLPLALSYWVELRYVNVIYNYRLVLFHLFYLRQVCVRLLVLSQNIGLPNIRLLVTVRMGVSHYAL